MQFNNSVVSLRKESYLEPINGWGPSESWRFTDSHGHEHYYDNGYPTLEQKEEEEYWCDFCDEFHSGKSYYVCKECGDKVYPSTKPVVYYRCLQTRYYINDQPVTEEEFKNAGEL